ncbi:MAG TPA: methylated-DNA--[protein]-cysteine S-methyltransferase [Marmoricola sp.]|nr:methylated-DNA--[protein]-cysteine S-methyltransferase [Marmoricola sp.]
MSATTEERATRSAVWTVMESPVGDLRIIAREGAIVAIEFSPFRGLADGRPIGDRADDDALLRRAVGQLNAYFARELREFDLPLAPAGSAFQRQVWDQLRRIPWGETASYGEIAHRLGHTNAASRAVGLANGRNPIPIVIPCHRVIGANGSLTGYAGGLDRKQLLLGLEQEALF